MTRPCLVNDFSIISPVCFQTTMSDRKQELASILFLARYLASVDGEFQYAEKVVFKELVDSFGIDSDELQSNKSVPIPELIDRLESEESRKLLLEVLTVIASADGSFQEKERLFISKVMDRIGVSSDDFSLFRAESELEIKEIYENIQGFLENIKIYAEHLKEEE